jgi:hypothetical protein
MTEPLTAANAPAEAKPEGWGLFIEQEPETAAQAPMPTVPPTIVLGLSTAAAEALLEELERSERDHPVLAEIERELESQLSR